MATKAIILQDPNIPPNGGTQISFSVALVDTATNTTVISYGDNLYFGTDLTTYSANEIQTVIQTKVVAYALTQGYTVNPADFLWEFPNPFSTSEAVLIKNSANKVYSAATRSLNTAFQISSTRETEVTYSIETATSVSLSGGAVGTVTLEYADNSGMTTNLVEVARTVNGNTGTLVVGLTLNQTTCTPLSGRIPAGKYVRIKTANTTGTPTFTYRSGQEVLS